MNINTADETLNYTATHSRSVSCGDRFGRLLVKDLSRIPVSHKRKRSRPCATVVCDCGTQKSVMTDDLVSGKVQSCGCLKRDKLKDRGKPVAEMFWAKVNKRGPVSEYRPDLGPCWLWTARVNAKGYGQFGARVGSTLAHRVSFEMAGGAIATGMQLDHLCRVRNCVNPRHLEAVPPHINTHRGYSPAAINARKTHCPQGHPYSDENVYFYVGGIHKGNRQCRICGRDRSRRYMERKKARGD